MSLRELRSTLELVSVEPASDGTTTIIAGNREGRLWSFRTRSRVPIVLQYELEVGRRGGVLHLQGNDVAFDVLVVSDGRDDVGAQANSGFSWEGCEDVGGW